MIKKKKEILSKDKYTEILHCSNKISHNKEKQQNPRNNQTVPNPDGYWSQLRAGVCFESTFWKIVVILRSLIVGLQVSKAVRGGQDNV